MEKPSKRKMSIRAASIRLARGAFQNDLIQLVGGVLQPELAPIFQTVGAMNVRPFWRGPGSYRNQRTIISIKIGNINAHRCPSERTR